MKIERGLVKTHTGYIHYRAAGGGEPVILLHINQQSSALFLELMEALAPALRPIAIDYPSHGMSDHMSRQPVIHDYARCVVEVMDALGARTPVILGEATGAVVAAELAVSFPERTGKVVLVNCPYYHDRSAAERGHSSVKISRPSDASGFPATRTLEFVLQHDPAHAPMHPTQSWMDRVNVAQVEAGRDRWQALEALGQYDIAANLARIQCPAMLLMGEHFHVRRVLRPGTEPSGRNHQGRPLLHDVGARAGSRAQGDRVRAALTLEEAMIMKIVRGRIGLVPLFLAGMSGAAIGAAPDAETYPSRPIRLIVTYAPGGGVDSVARAIAPGLTGAWGQQVIVDNRAGGGGIIGTEIAAKAPPDGHTLLMGTSAGLVINPLLHSRLPYHPVRDFSPVSLLVVSTMLLVVNGSVPAGSVKELVAFAKARPGKLSYASVGQGSPNHIATELFKVLTGTDMVHVPYKGAGPALVELLGGQVQVMFNPMTPLLPHVKGGKLKALAVGNATRSLAAPDIPTVAEAGIPNFEAAPWYGLFAPARTPGRIVAKLNAQIAKTLRDPELARRLISGGAEPRPGTPEMLARFMREDSERVKMVIASARIGAD